MTEMPKLYQSEQEGGPIKKEGLRGPGEGGGVQTSAGFKVSKEKENSPARCQ